MELPDQIMVERFTGDQSVTMICHGCEHEWAAHPDFVMGYQGGPYGCEKCGRELADFKYVEADKCPNCEALGFWTSGDGLKGCCSRLCALQWEYAQRLRERKAALAE